MATSYTQTHTSHDLTFVDIKVPTCTSICVLAIYKGFDDTP
jgi:hypothetical protein